MSSVYQKLGLFGKTYWKDDGLFAKRISKKEYDQFVLKNEVAKELKRQQKRKK